MKKKIVTVFLRSLPVVLLVSGFSCWSPFEPVTNIGKDVVTGIDSNVTNLKSGFRVLDSIDLGVNGARSLVAVGNDTGIGKVQSGDHPLFFGAGRFGDDSAVGYVDFQMYSSSLAGFRTACDSSADTIKLLLYYDTINNDVTIQDPATIKVYSCARKYFPGVRNDLSTVDSAVPCTTITFSRAVPDSFFISLGANMVDRFKSAIADTAGIVRLIAKIDTVAGPDTSFDTTFIFDSTKKFIGAVSVHADGGMVNFSRKPAFQVKYRSTCSDSVEQIFTGNYFTYFDICVKESNPIPSDSLVASWQADRFVEMPIDLGPLWDSVRSNGNKDLKIVQDASCILNTGTSFFEGLDKNDSVRTIVYGLLDHQITGSRVQSFGTRDSLILLMDGGRLKSITVHADSTRLSLPMTMFLQSLVDQGKKPIAYLYLFERQPSSLTTPYFGRIVFDKSATIRFSALFSNSH
jgi:hypothetical protein